MKEERLRYLLDRYINNRLEKEESDELNDWYHSLEYPTTDINSWIDNAGGLEEFEREMYLNLVARLDKKPKVHRLWPQIAAAAILLVAMTFGFFYVNKHSAAKIKEQSASVLNHIAPGYNNALLILPGGQKVNVGSAKIGNLLTGKLTSIVKINDNELVFKNNSHELTDASYTLATTNGRFSVVLQDGTRVWLNSQSKLIYPVTFSGSKREVRLIGEAYFEVAHDASKPFTVITNKQVVTDIGTHFDVRSYEDENSVRTTLTEGIVRVDVMGRKISKVLKPGEQTELTNQLLSTHEADIEEIMSWKSGLFIFNDEDIHTIMKELSRWYDVEILYADDFTNKKFGASISRDKNLDEVLQTIQLTKGIHFKIDGRRVIVMK